MQLIHFEGINCHLNCIVSIAASLGIAYPSAFSSLWSETDLGYHALHQAYASKRVLANLKTMGICLGPLNSDVAANMAPAISLLADEDFLIIGMDAFYIPWSPVYQLLHDPHYFFARQGDAHALLCYDATYQKAHMHMPHTHVVAYAFEFYPLHRVAAKPLPVDIEGEAKEVLQNHPRFEQTMLCDICACAGDQRRRAGLLAKYADALIDNRYLFGHFLQQLPDDVGLPRPFFADAFFSQWQAVKNGLYKASLKKDNTDVLQDVCRLYGSLIEQELDLAHQLLAISRMRA